MIKLSSDRASGKDGGWWNLKWERVGMVMGDLDLNGSRGHFRDLANPDFDEKVRLQMSPNRGLPRFLRKNTKTYRKIANAS